MRREGISCVGIHLLNRLSRKLLSIGSVLMGAKNGLIVVSFGTRRLVELPVAVLTPNLPSRCVRRAQLMQRVRGKYSKGGDM